MSEEEKENTGQWNEPEEEKRGVKDVLIQTLFYIAFFIALVVFLLFSNNAEENKGSKNSATKPQTTAVFELPSSNMGVDH